MKKTEKKGNMNAFFWVVFGVLVAYTALMFLLFALGLNTSLKPLNQIRLDNDYFGLPDLDLWQKQIGSKNIFYNYIKVFQELKIDGKTGIDTSYYAGLFTLTKMPIRPRADLIWATVYTAVYAVGGALVATFVPMFMGYLCAKYTNKVSTILYGVVVFVMAVPIVGAQPATINLMRRLRLFDTFYGDWLRKASFTNMYFLIFYAYFKSLASSYDEAAEIDGASQLTVMFRICLPLAKSIFGTVFLMLFVSFWNDYTTPMMFIPSYPTLSYLVYIQTTYLSGQPLAQTVYKFAALMTFAIPIIIIFCIFNKRLMSNMTMGGIKG